MVRMNKGTAKDEGITETEARGAMLNQTSVEAKTCAGANSTGAFAGARLIEGAEVATAAPAMAQNGQKSKVPLAEVRSAQKWNCAARKTSPSRSAQIRSLLVFRSMPGLLVGRKWYLKSTAEWKNPRVRSRFSLKVRGPLGGGGCSEGTARGFAISLPARF